MLKEHLLKLELSYIEVSGIKTEERKDLMKSSRISLELTWAILILRSQLFMRARILFSTS